MEKEADSQGAEQESYHKEYRAFRASAIGYQLNQRHAGIQGKPVEYCRDEGEEISLLEAAHHQREDHQQAGLQHIFCHAEGEERHCLRQLPMHQIGRRHHHGQAEVSPLHERRSEGEYQKARDIGSFCIKGFLMCHRHSVLRSWFV